MPVRHDAQANLMIDKLKEQMDSIKAENAQLRAQNADLIECKMDLYLQDRRSKLSKLNVEDYQKLIFGELRRSNEIHASILELIEPHSSREQESLHIAITELDLIKKDTLEYSGKEVSDVLENVEKKIEMIVEILQTNLQNLERENSKDNQEMEIRLQRMIIELEGIFNEEQIQRLNTTVEIKCENSSAGDEIKLLEQNLKIAEENLENTQEKLKLSEKRLEIVEEKIKASEEEFKIVGKKLKISEEKIKISEEKLTISKDNEKVLQKSEAELNKKISTLNEIIKEKDLIIKDLHSMVSSMDEKLRSLEMSAKKRTEQDQKAKTFEVELKKLKSVEESQMEQIAGLLQHEEKLKFLLDDANKKLNIVTKMFEKTEKALEGEKLKNSNNQDSELLGEIENLNKKIFEAQESSYNAKNERDQVQIKFEKANCTVEQLKSKILDMDNSMKTQQCLNKEYFEMKGSVERYQKQIKKLEAEKSCRNKPLTPQKNRPGIDYPTSNPFAEEMKSPCSKTGSFWNDESKRAMRELDKKLLDKDAEIDTLQTLLCEIQSRPKTPRRDTFSQKS